MRAGPAALRVHRFLEFFLVNAKPAPTGATPRKELILKHLIAMRATVAAALLACAATAQCAPSPLQKITYYSQDLTWGLAYVITWDTAALRAHFVETYGNFDGSYVDDGTQRVFTLDKPLVLAYQIADCNGNAMTLNDVTTQLAFRTVSGAPDKGMSALVPIGYTEDVGGCTPGRVAPYGQVTDAGIPLVRRAASLRPSMDDLVPGAQIAGLAENPIDAYGDLAVLSAQVATFGRNHITFERTGHRFPTHMTPDGWLVIDFGSFKRAYTRIDHQHETGGETWFGAEWVNGAPASIELSPAVKPTFDAGFGDLRDTARQWFDGLFQYEATTDFDLYRDHTGIEATDLGDGSPRIDRPLTWSRTGAAVQIRRANSSATYVQTWHPVAKHGKYHFVIENEEVYVQGADTGPIYAPRINWYVDQGVAIEPVPQKAAASPQTSSRHGR